MKPRHLLTCLLLWLASLPAWATPQTTNATGLWWKSDESGWGLYLVHQGETIFATLFVYGPDNQPRWYSASSLACDDGGPVQDRPRSCVGPLYESSGSPFNVPFDAGAVTRRQVGTMALELGSSASIVTYDVDGLRVTKSITPITFKASYFSGSFVGLQYQPATTTQPEVTDSVNVTINADNYPSVIMQTEGTSSGACAYSATATAVNMRVRLAGNFACSDSRSGPFSLEIDPTQDGFAGRFTGNKIRDSLRGRMEAVSRNVPSRLGNGWMSDLWVAADESGWGLNIVGQGPTLFATLFVYDGNRRPKWYSSSALDFGYLNGPQSRGVYEGALVESTGPWYGLVSFNPGAVARREVGRILLDFHGDREVYLRYTVDGVTVTKLLQPLAFRANRLTGTYVGTRMDIGISAEQARISITDDASGVTIVTTTTKATCTYRAPPDARVQNGQRVYAQGSYNCGGLPGTFVLADAEVSYDGFVATLNVDGRPGHLAGVRSGF